MASEHSNRGAKRAREARAALGFTREGPLPDVLHAVEERGGVHVLVLELPEGVAGAYAARAGCPLLFVNGAQAISRQRFTLAHEFGHHRLGHGSTVDQQGAISGKDRAPAEVSANAFAAEFLMPRDAIAAWGRTHLNGSPTLEDVVALACEYGVSAQAARYALTTARVLTDERRAAALDQEIVDELHIELAQRLALPYVEDELADAASHLPRIAPTLRASAMGDFLAGACDVDELAQRLGHDAPAVREMLAELRLDELLPA